MIFMNSLKYTLILLLLLTYNSSVNSENINNIKSILKVEFFGNYIPKEAKINSSFRSFYFLPSDLFQRNHKSKNNQVYFINHMAFGNLDNDGITDLIMSYEMEVCPGKLKLSSIGVPLCEVEEGGIKYLNFSAFTVTEQTRNNINKKFKQFSNLGRNCQRPILADLILIVLMMFTVLAHMDICLMTSFILAVLMLYLYQIKMENGFKLKK